MSANPIWIAGYFGPVAGASPVWIAPGDGTVPSAVQSEIVSYYAPVVGATAVWIAGFFAPPPAAIGATPITISGWGGSGGGAPAHSAEALAYLARTVGGNEGGNAANIATLIDGLVSDGVWAKLDALYVLAQQNATDAVLNLIGTSYSLPSGIGTFTTYVGYSAFPTTGGMDTGFNPNTATSPNYVLNSASAGVWVYEADTNGGIQIGTAVGGQLQIVSNFNLGGQFQFNVNCIGVSISTPGTTGLFCGDTTAASQVHPYWNGVDKGVQTGSGSGLPASTVKIGGAPGGWQVNKNLSAAFIGASLGAAGQLALYNRLRTYMSSVGVP